jgi:hypothetical protein
MVAPSSLCVLQKNKLEERRKYVDSMQFLVSPSLSIFMPNTHLKATRKNYHHEKTKKKNINFISNFTLLNFSPRIPKT